MRDTDRRAIHEFGTPGIVLMEHAGRHVAEAVMGVIQRDGCVYILCGKGNNGGDGFVAARHLAEWGIAVHLFASMHENDVMGDAKIAAQAAISAQCTVHWKDAWSLNDLRNIRAQDVIVDALLGTGVSGSLRPFEASVVERLNASPAYVIAVDIPSGVCADSGQILGVAVRADLTITFQASQPGHWLFPGSDCCGPIRIVDIGMSSVAMPTEAPGVFLMTHDVLQPAFRKRARCTHKGHFGHVGCIGGSLGQTGAILMAADAAMAAGAGLTTVGTSEEVMTALVASAYEVMTLPLFGVEADSMRRALAGFDAWVVGPGLSDEAPERECLRHIVGTTCTPLVIDAGALNIISEWRSRWTPHSCRVVTPHPGEAARLLDCSVSEVQSDRFSAARQLAHMCHSVCVLKGAHTIVADPSGELWVCASGSPGMSTAGMGDVLAGIIGSLLARQIPAKEASIAGVLWHALAGEVVQSVRSENGLRARDVIESLAEVERCYQDWT